MAVLKGRDDAAASGRKCAIRDGLVQVLNQQAPVGRKESADLREMALRHPVHCGTDE